MNAPRFQMPDERLPVQSGPVDISIPWHIRDLSEWVDQNCTVNVEARIEDGALEFRITDIIPDDTGFETLSTAASVAAQKKFHLQRGRIGNDPDFVRAVSEAAEAVGIFEGEAE